MFNFLAKSTFVILKRLNRPATMRGIRESRGVAMVVVLITIAILSVAVVEFVYGARVNTALASNERDQLKSYFMARSSLNLAKLLLSFQYALQSESKETDDDLGKLIGRAMRRSNFQMYQYIDLLMGPFNSGKIESPVGGINLQDTGVSGFGDFIGDMDVNVVPEEGRLDVKEFASKEVKQAQLQKFCALLLDSNYDELFEQKDADGITMDRATVLQRIVDYIDPNEEGISLTNLCTVEGSAGDERKPYDDDRLIKPRNRKITHIDELYQVAGISAAFMDEFKDQFTVYPVGKPNLNVASAPIFYSVLCRNISVKGQKGSRLDACLSNPAVALEVLMISMALEGIKVFFENPMSVLLAYVGTTNSRLLPSAKKGQPVGFLSVSQLPSYIKDLKKNPQLMAQFLVQSPLYQRLALTTPGMVIDPVNPQFPPWTVKFKKSGLMKSVTVKTPNIYRIIATGQYGSTKSTIEAVIDFERTVRRLPSEAALEDEEADEDRLAELKKLRDEIQAEMPKGRVLFWREY